MKRLNIVNLYKHNIVYKNIKHRQINLLIMSLIICMVSIFSFVYMYNVNDVVHDSAKVFNPISELYRDVEVASFVNGNFSFIVPIKTDQYVIGDNSIEFKVGSSIMVYAPANGVIESIDRSNRKTIKIKHSENVFSVISNVEIVGVKIGEIVKQGKEIATAKVGETLTFSIEKDGRYINGLYLNKSYVKWKEVK